MDKVRLLNDGGYVGMRALDFPIFVDAEITSYGAVLVPYDEMVLIGYKHFDGDCNIGDDVCFYIGSECEVVSGNLATPSTPQTTDIYVNCEGIEEVSCGSGGFKQHVHLSEVCVEDIIQNIGPETFFNAFDNEELAEHLRKYGYEVEKND